MPNKVVTHYEVEAGKEKSCHASREEDVADAIDHLVEREPCIGQNRVMVISTPRLCIRGHGYKCADDVICEGGGYHFATGVALLGKHKTVSPILHVLNKRVRVLKRYAVKIIA